MRAAIYSPYFDSLGGGERYVISVGKVLKDNGWDVYVQSKDSEIVDELENRFGLDLAGMQVVGDIKRGNGYDLCFWLSDGSIPTLFARKNILHFQRPFYNVDGKSLINRMKFFRINKVVVNSLFTKSWIDREFPCQSVVLYPPVDVTKFKAVKKENLIIAIGRFSQLEQAKRQDVLVKVFKKMFDANLKDWRLVLAGGSEVGRTKYVDQLKKAAKYYPIEIIEKPPFKKIKDLYTKAKVFWSAAGFGFDEKRRPEKMEHFGITTVEAMAAGVTPVVYAAGGHKEIVTDGKNGFLWGKPGDLIQKTRELIDNQKLLRRLSLQARSDCGRFSYERFAKEFLALL